LLYDALYEFEACRRGLLAYPVHKTLVSGTARPEDIYEWIAERVGPAKVRHLLDAGCGVGYGSLLLARRLGCRVTGVSVSEREVARAREAALDAKLDHRLEFKLASFDDLPCATYDLIVAVESLKHSSDLPCSVRSMLAALKPGGTLVIVDDCYDSRRREAVERQLTADWALTKLYGERDFVAALGASPCTVVDLSDRVPRSGRSWIALRLLGVELARLFVGERADRALRAFRGGLRLEQLYAERAMTYKAILVETRAG
jgi:SAM-dependent methyltransferase